MHTGETRIIVATDLLGGIGLDNKLPWADCTQKADMARFRNLTRGGVVIMGRKTHESIGRCLPGRLNIVLSRNPTYRPCGVAICAGSLPHAMNIAQMMWPACDDRFIIGGAATYEQAIALKLVDQIDLTVIETKMPADSFFSFAADAWAEVSRAEWPASEGNDHPYSFVTLRRRQSP